MNGRIWMNRRPTTTPFRLSLAIALSMTPVAASAQLGSDATKADAERSIASYLSLWANNGSVDAAAVRRFYAPQVTYYGHAMTRDGVLADKLAFIHRWPVRHYREVPDTLVARCNTDRSRCRVAVTMAWTRTGRAGRRAAGTSRIAFTFVPAEGSRKIGMETAKAL